MLRPVREHRDIVIERELSFDHTIKQRGIKRFFGALQMIALDRVGKLDIGVNAVIFVF